MDNNRIKGGEILKYEVPIDPDNFNTSEAQIIKLVGHNYILPIFLGKLFPNLFGYEFIFKLRAIK